LSDALPALTPSTEPIPTQISIRIDILESPCFSSRFKPVATLHFPQKAPPLKSPITSTKENAVYDTLIAQLVEHLLDSEEPLQSLESQLKFRIGF
jgi:hypothetical protein